MKFKTAFIFLFFYCMTGYAKDAPQRFPIAPSLANKITIDNFCLCSTTLSDLQKLDPDLQPVEVEELNLCKDGVVQDARFVNGKGYASKKFPGIIFQKDINTDFISKIRLTKDFVGSLPDGTPINMKTLTAKDVLKMYPKFDTWRSRRCSEYWDLTNDTLSFFIKIDKSKQPQYPVDEAYYSDKPVEGIELIISCYSIFPKAKQEYAQPFKDPVFFVDSMQISKVELQKFKPTDIAFASVYKDSNAIKLMGAQGEFGVVYLTTKKFARNGFWNFFKEKSSEYLKAVPNAEINKNVVYILNGKILNESEEVNLFHITNENFISLDVINKESLSKEYQIQNRDFGIVIRCKK